MDEDGLKDPEVCFTFCVSCDDEPEEIVERVRHEWRRRGGNKLEASELRCLETAPAMVLFNISNEGNLHAIRAEALRLMAAKHKKDTEMALDCENPWDLCGTWHNRAGPSIATGDTMSFGRKMKKNHIKVPQLAGRQWLLIAQGNTRPVRSFWESLLYNISPDLT